MSNNITHSLHSKASVLAKKPITNRITPQEILENLKGFSGWQRIAKQKKPLSVRFRLRPENRNNPPKELAAIYVCFCVNGGDPMRLDTRIRVKRDMWDVKSQQVRGQSEEAYEINMVLSAIKVRLQEIHRVQIERHKSGGGVLPTTSSLNHEFVKGSPPVITSAKCINAKGKELEYEIRSGMGIKETMSAYLIHLRQEKVFGRGLDDRTFVQWVRTQKRLHEYLGDSDIMCSSITISWAKQFHAWILRHQNQVSPKITTGVGLSTARRHVRRLSRALDFLVDMGGLGTNPLFTLKLPRGADKEVYFLEEQHIDRLFQLTLPGSIGIALWWMKLICVTGLDYPDAVLYVQNRAKYERDTINGRKIVICRSKTPHGECHIPVQPELVALFEEYPTGPKALAPQTVNKFMHDDDPLLNVEKLIGFDRRLTCKIGRKSAGVLFLNRGYRMEAVSRILGHATTTITEKHYVKVTGSLVDREMERLGSVS